MTDLHTHILYNVDDGSKSFEESLEMINKLSFLGFDKIISTSHFIEGTSYCADNEVRGQLLLELQKHTDVKLYLSNEIFINPYIDEYIDNNYIMPINKNTLLIELPMSSELKDALDILYELKTKGFRIILAHPERYTYFQDKYSLIDKFKEYDILFQCNFGSIIGLYGHNAEKLMKYLLKKGWVDYLGSDVHRANSTFFNNFAKIEKHIIKYVGKDGYEQIIKNGDSLVS